MSVTTMTISVLASRAGVGVETVRYYQRSGLMTEPAKPPSGYRQYGHSDLQRLLFIRRAKRLGFSLKDIRALLALDTGTRCQTTRNLAASRLKDVQARMHDLQVMARSLESMVASCDQNIAAGVGVCPAIDNIISEQTIP
ncbi:MerR family transcriptional regulator [Aliamphritea hakodatensis]|uniref:MerR family transcriptional regulator n=1 Tax=Aliamphritea hakodatensis TaxID=2895352 RepID=UPI0022FD70D4|nr:MerR family transcriptional regulator [Aliamphritea hakodatensis]